MQKEEKIRNWCRAKIACGYVWGATGQVLTEASLRILAERYPSTVNPSIVRRWLGKQVYDCATFARFAMQEIGIRLPSGASSQWKRTKWAAQGEIERIPKDRVVLVYRTSPTANPMQHVGVYLGDGQVVDARSSRIGVIESALSSYPWTHWGIPEGLEIGNPKLQLEEKTNLTIIKEKRNMANPQTMKQAFGTKVIGLKGVRHGNAVRNVQLCVIDYANDTSNFVDGSFGNKTMQAVKDYQAANGFAQVDGVVGKATMQSLWNNYESRLKAQGYVV